MRGRPAGSLAASHPPAGPANSLRSDSRPGLPCRVRRRGGGPEIGGYLALGPLPWITFKVAGKSQPL